MSTVYTSDRVIQDRQNVRIGTILDRVMQLAAASTAYRQAGRVSYAGLLNEELLEILDELTQFELNLLTLMAVGQLAAGLGYEICNACERVHADGRCPQTTAGSAP
jgi:hypothetical protein